MYIRMRSWIARLMILGAAGTAGAPLWAGQYTPQCQSASDQANQKCDAAIKQAKGVDNNNYTSGMAAQGTNVNSNAVVQKPGITSNDAAIGSAISQCTAAKGDCSQKCETALGQAQAAVARGDMSAQSDVSEIPNIKSNQCEQQIQKKIDELQANKAPLDQKAKEAQNTKDASDKGGGGMPQMPQMPQPKDSDDTGSSPSAVTPVATALNCNATDASRFSDCNTSFVSKCMSSMANAECDTFTDRYCNLSSGAATPALSQATTNLVIDQKSEGLSSNYCNYALAARYCQTSGREQCASCTQMVAQQQCAENNVCSSAQSSAAAVNALRTSCPDDPYYVTGGFTLTPLTGSASAYAASLASTASASSALPSTSLATGTVTSNSGAVTAATLPGVTMASVGGGASGVTGASGGGALGGGSSATAARGTAADGSNREGLPNGIVPAADSGGGAGGAGNGDQSHDSSWTAETAGAAAGIKAALDKRAPASTVAGLSNDVAATAGPSIFSIGSGGIQKFCARSQLTGCAK